MKKPTQNGLTRGEFINEKISLRFLLANTKNSEEEKNYYWSLVKTKKSLRKF